MFEREIDGCRLILKQGDITEQDTDAVVNAANKRLAPGGGVAGAIHRAAGKQLWEHCKDSGGCETGEAVITPGFNLEAPHIIHTVGPVYSQHPQPEEALQKSYVNSLRLANKKNIESISFPALSTGAFGYPLAEAAIVSLNAIISFLSEEKGALNEVRLVLYSEGEYEVFKETANKILN